jgi:hypothetical protein
MAVATLFMASCSNDLRVKIKGKVSQHINGPVQIASIDNNFGQTTDKTVTVTLPAIDTTVIRELKVKACSDQECQEACSAEQGTTATSVILRDLAEGQKYYFCVAAVDRRGVISPWTPHPTPFLTDWTAPTPPSNITFSQQGSASEGLNIHFDKSSDAALVTYEAKLCRSSECSGDCIATSETAETDVKLAVEQFGAIYFACVKAKGESGNHTSWQASDPIYVTPAGSYLNLTDEQKPLFTGDPSTICSDVVYHDVNGQLRSGTKNCDISQLKPENIRSGVTLLGVAGNVVAAPGDCNAEGGVGCVTVAAYPSVSITGLAAKVLSGYTVAGVAGVAGGESHLNCTGANQSGCVATATYRTMDLSSNALTDLTSGNFNTTINGVSDFEFWDSTGARHQVSGDVDLAAANIASGVIIFGVSGGAGLETHSNCTGANQTGCVSTETYKTMDLSSNALTDLTSGGFNATIAGAANFEFWDSAGARHEVNGDPDLIAANIKNGTTLFGVGGNVVPAPADCSADGGVGCVAVAAYAAAATTGLAAKVVSGNTVAGVAGTVTAESHSSCTGANQTGCVSTDTYKTMDLSSNALTDLTSGGFNATIAGAANFEFWDSAGARHEVSGDPDLIAANIKNGTTLFGVGGNVVPAPADCSADGGVGCVAVAAYAAAATTGLAAKVVSGNTVAGVAGTVTAEFHLDCTGANQTGCISTSTYRTMDLSSNALSDLTSGNFNTTINGVSDFEFWDSTGARHQVSGDVDLAVANIASGVTIFGVSGGASLETHSNCTGANQTGCVSTDTYKTMDLSSNVLTDLTSGGFNATIAGAANFEFWDSAGARHEVSGDPDLIAANIKNGTTLFGVGGNVVPAPADCSADGGVGCVAVAAYAAAATTGLAAKVVSGNTVAGVAGTVTAEFHLDCTGANQTGCISTSTYRTMDLSSNALSDLTSGNFNTTINGVSDFEFWDSTGARHQVSGDVDLAAGNVRSGITIFGIAGSSVQESHANCTSDGDTSCIAVAAYRAAATSGLAAKVVSGYTVAGIAGSATGESHSDCTGASQAGCIATSTYRTMDLTSNALTDLTAGNFNSSLATAGNFEFWDSAGARHQISGNASFTEANIKNGVTLFGVTGGYPSSTYLLTGATATADLDSATFNAKIKGSSSFEYFTPAGVLQTGSGDVDLANDAIIRYPNDVFGTVGTLADCVADGAAGCVTTSRYKSVDTTSFINWDVRHGKTVGGIVGAMKTNCRNRINSNIFNYDGDTSTIPIAVGTTAGSALDWWDTIDNWNNNIVALPTGSVPGSDISNECNNTSWVDVTSDGLCDSAADDCIFKDRATLLMWTEPNPVTGADPATTVATAKNWRAAVNGCNLLTYGGYDDWRLPTVFELQHAAMNGYRYLYFRGGTATTTTNNNPNFSPDIDAYWIWSATTASSATEYAHAILFADSTQYDFVKNLTVTDVVGWNYPLIYICVR